MATSSSSSPQTAPNPLMVARPCLPETTATGFSHCRSSILFQSLILFLCERERCHRICDSQPPCRPPRLGLRAPQKPTLWPSGSRMPLFETPTHSSHCFPFVSLFSICVCVDGDEWSMEVMESSMGWDSMVMWIKCVWGRWIEALCFWLFGVGRKWSVCVGENLCCVRILGWSENERMMDYGGRWKKVGEDEGVVFFFYFLENRMKESPLSEEGEGLLNEGILMILVVSAPIISYLETWDKAESRCCFLLFPCSAIMSIAS